MPSALRRSVHSRREPRVPVSSPGRLEGRATQAVTLVDLSLHGCLVRCARPPLAGAIRDLCFDLEGSAMRVKARVAEVSVDGAAPLGEPAHLAGLEFVGLGAGDESRLRRFVEARRRRPDA
jgi:hypothetical protein